MRRSKAGIAVIFLTLFAILLVMPSACEVYIAPGSVTFRVVDSTQNMPEPDAQINQPKDTPNYEYKPEPEPEPDRISGGDSLHGEEIDPYPEPGDEPGDEPGGEDKEPDMPQMLLPFNPRATENTNPDIMLSLHGISPETPEGFPFTAQTDFGFSHDYALIDGITTFRGNNFRDSASFGRADIRTASFGDRWSRDTGSLRAPDGAVWTGHGWTGQPLIVRWPRETRAIMNMHAWAKEQEELVEVIYPAMDGFIYFLELTTGRNTRDRLNIGFTFKGTGAIDPRGYPLLYVGAGYESAHGAARVFIISLINGSILHTFGNHDGFAIRTWNPADAAPLIDSENDRLFYASENGLIYVIDLNTEFDPDAGTISINPKTIKWRFRGKRSHVDRKFWLGIESSPAIHRGHMFLADNGGHFICLDLNTLQPVWVKDILDDTNTSPVIAIEDGHPYIYMSTGFHGGWRVRANSAAPIPVWKIDAVTGEDVWRVDFSAFTVQNLSGGVQGTIASGKYGIDHLIFVPIARSPNTAGGTLAAINKQTGEVEWEFQTSTYSWSSPVAIYDHDGRGFIIYTTSNSDLHLLDGLTGELLDTVKLGRLIEASPAVFENIVVIGTRCQRIVGVEIR